MAVRVFQIVSLSLIFGFHSPVSLAALEGDTNGDGVVDLIDLNAVKNCFGTNHPYGDTNDDGVVGLADLNAIWDNFGKDVRATTVAPVITTVTPTDGSSFCPPQGIPLNVTATEPRGATLEYRFILDGQLIRNWNSSNTFSLPIASVVVGERMLDMQVRNPSGRRASQQIRFYLFRQPIEGGEVVS